MAYKPQTVAVFDGGTGLRYEINLGGYGDGSDGMQTFDGTTTILTMIPISNVYTLLRDTFLSTSSINNGVTIITNGFRIFCNSTLTNNGTMRWNGNDGTALGVAGGVTSNANSPFNWNTTNGAPGTAGGEGNLGVGTSGVNMVTTITFGGVGAAGGAGASAGGGGGGAIPLPERNGNMRDSTRILITYLIASNIAFVRVGGGTGAGGGGGDGSFVGGGGGGGGAIVVVSSLYIAGTGTISANGGNGGNGQAGATSAGGGGGGGGGFVMIMSRSANAGAITGQTITVSGGTGGTKVGTGVDGTNGSNGTTVILTG